MSSGLHWRKHLGKCRLRSQHLQHECQHADVDVWRDGRHRLWNDLPSGGCCCWLLLREEAFAGNRHRRVRIWLRYIRLRAARDVFAGTYEWLAWSQLGAGWHHLVLWPLRRTHATFDISEEEQGEAADAAYVRGETDADGARIY